MTRLFNPMRLPLRVIAGCIAAAGAASGCTAPAPAGFGAAADQPTGIYDRFGEGVEGNEIGERGNGY